MDNWNWDYREEYFTSRKDKYELDHEQFFFLISKINSFCNYLWARGCIRTYFVKVFESM